MTAEPAKEDQKKKRTLGGHLRATFLAGLFAVLPIAATVYLLVQVELIFRSAMIWLLGWWVPLLGPVVVVALIYLAGLAVTNFVGQWFVGLLDRLLSRVPFVREAYLAWRQISYSPGGGEGMFAKVALVPAGDAGPARAMGFTDGVASAETGLVCVFVPNTPNCVVGRLLFVPESAVVYLDVAVEEAFKALISTGNYLPPMRTAPTVENASQPNVPPPPDSR